MKVLIFMLLKLFQTAEIARGAGPGRTEETGTTQVKKGKINPNQINVKYFSVIW